MVDAPIGMEEPVQDPYAQVLVPWYPTNRKAAVPLVQVDLRRDRLPILSAVAANAAAGTLFAWSVLVPALSVEFGRPAAELGSIFSTGMVAFAVAILCGGTAVDRHGSRRAMAVGGLISAGGIALGAAAGNVLVLHLGVGVLFGLGSGLTYLSAVYWATTRAGGMWAVGVVVASFAAGPVVTAPLGSLGVDRLGWRTTLIVAAITVGAVIVLASRGLPGPQEPSPALAGEAEGKMGDAPALAALWWFALGAFAPGLLAFANAAHVATERGVSPRSGGVAVALMAAANLTGRLCAASLVLRIGLCRALAADLGALSLSLLALAWLPGAASVVVGLSLLGVQYGLTSALLPVATREVSSESRFGTAYGRVFSSWGVAGVLGPALGAALYDESRGYSRSFEASLGGAAIAVLALIAFRHRRGAGHDTDSDF
jgi:MFS transporter, OFA family, oxalate/formate antiporter